jgi:ABC-type antimicrobial peptide transport system permease subunit
MTVAWIIGLILSFILFNLLGCLYYDYDGDRNNKVFKKEYKLKRPLWLVSLFFMSSLVPILNIILPIVLFCVIGVCINDRDIYFHSENKLINFLNKNI